MGRRFQGHDVPQQAQVGPPASVVRARSRGGLNYCAVSSLARYCMRLTPQIESIGEIFNHAKTRIYEAGIRAKLFDTRRVGSRKQEDARRVWARLILRTSKPTKSRQLGKPPRTFLHSPCIPCPLRSTTYRFTRLRWHYRTAGSVRQSTRRPVSTTIRLLLLVMLTCR